MKSIIQIFEERKRFHSISDFGEWVKSTEDDLDTVENWAVDSGASSVNLTATGNIRITYKEHKITIYHYEEGWFARVEREGNGKRFPITYCCKRSELAEHNKTISSKTAEMRASAETARRRFNDEYFNRTGNRAKGWGYDKDLNSFEQKLWDRYVKFMDSIRTYIKDSNVEFYDNQEKGGYFVFEELDELLEFIEDWCEEFEKYPDITMVWNERESYKEDDTFFQNLDDNSSNISNKE